MSAGDNEYKFRELMIEKYGKNCLAGKQSYSLKLDKSLKVSISVDESIVFNGQEILIEIDSGNMAKLIAGQYALLNGMYTADKSKCMFLVVHFYQDNKTGKHYNALRTLKNLNAIQHFNAHADWIPFNAFNIREFNNLLSESNCLEELIKKVWPTI